MFLALAATAAPVQDDLVTTAVDDIDKTEWQRE